VLCTSGPVECEVSGVATTRQMPRTHGGCSEWPTTGYLVRWCDARVLGQAKEAAHMCVVLSIILSEMKFEPAHWRCN